MIFLSLLREVYLRSRRFSRLFSKSVSQYYKITTMNKSQKPKRIASKIYSHFPNIVCSFQLLEILNRHE